MKVNKNLIVVVLSVLLSSFAFPFISSASVSAQSSDGIGALQRGYRTGYSDGYMAGYKDTIDSVSKDYNRHADYIRADRAYSKDYGELQDYRDGYQQGFESGYSTGFDRQTFDAALPAGLQKRGTATAARAPVAETKTVEMTNPPTPPPPAAATIEEANSNAVPGQTEQVTTEQAATIKTADAPVPDPNPGTTEQPAPAADASTSAIIPASYQAPAGDPIVIIPRDTELIIELQDELSTQQSREGQKFTAKVASPSEIAGATIEGRVSRVRQAGRLRQRSELTLSFDRIVLSDNRWSNFNGIMVEVIPVKGDNISRVDTEGTAIGHSTFKHDAVTVGGTTGVGTVIGAVTGGPVGAAIGAGVGAAFGVGAIVIDRGKQVHLNKNQQIRIKSSYETQIR
jgi:hypothetical protein